MIKLVQRQYKLALILDRDGTLIRLNCGRTSPSTSLASPTRRYALAEVLDKARAGRLAPESIAIRVLVSDTAAPMTLPAWAAVITCMPGILPDHPQQTGTRVTGRSRPPDPAR